MGSRAEAALEPQRRQGGFTMMELLVVIAIGSVVTGAVLVIWFGLGASFRFTARATESRDFARDALSRMAREIRDMEPLPGEDAIWAADGGSIQFTTTFNSDGNEDSKTPPVLTEYRVESGQLLRRRDTNEDQSLEDEADRVVVDNVLSTTTGDDALLEYVFPGSESSTVDPSEPSETDYAAITIVRIRLLIDVNGDQQAPMAADFSTVVQLRNQQQL